MEEANIFKCNIQGKSYILWIKQEHWHHEMFTDPSTLRYLKDIRRATSLSPIFSKNG
ncbi:hypothetical protein HanXRQr2_Chr12g0532001 [Helianthus annuus]|uniref:Uncharacterized protein n=1 Tax=Helianthus annuus TaxID=4232 RepID=A0A9K3MUT7_HELAN|nr:hypothetical protein HanXRQr2_Chr12g0532001 [Helianthus annuus]